MSELPKDLPGVINWIALHLGVHRSLDHKVENAAKQAIFASNGAVHQHERCDDSLEVHGPGGWWGRISGERIAYLLLILACAAFLWWSDEQRSKGFVSQHQITQKLLVTVIENQRMIITSLDATNKNIADSAAVNTYVLTLSQKDREALRLNMPQALRERVR